MNTENKKYRLLKDLPEIKAGRFFIYVSALNKYYLDGNPILRSYLIREVENNPDFFELVTEPKEEVTERIQVEGSIFYLNSNHDGSVSYGFVTKEIPIDKFHPIKEAIEAVLNNDTVENDGGFKGEKLIELLRDCVSSTWGNPSLTETQLLFDKFLHDRKLSKASIDLFNDCTNYYKSKNWQVQSFICTLNDEIIYRDSDGSFGRYKVEESFFINSSLHKINSVKRLSDGVVFSVNDRIGWGQEGFVNSTRLVDFVLDDKGHLKIKYAHHENYEYVYFEGAYKLHKK